MEKSEKNLKRMDRFLPLDLSLDQLSLITVDETKITPFEMNQRYRGAA